MNPSSTGVEKWFALVYTFITMLVLRFQRVGRKNDPNFRVVVNEKARSAKAGRFIELVGSYNPRTKAVNLNAERIRYWLSVGVQPSGTVHNLLVSNKIIEAKKVHVSRSSRKAAAETVAASEPKSAASVEPSPTA